MNCRLLQRDDLDQPSLSQIRRAIAEGSACQVVLRNYRKDGSLFYNELAISPVLSPEGKVTHYVGVQNDIIDRMAAEQVLALRTERLNAVFELSPDGFVVLDKRGEVSIVNPAFERMTGLFAVDLVGQSMAAFDETLLMHCSGSESPDALVWADTDKLGQAVLNVLSNAYKYSPQGGDIVLRQKLDADARRVIIKVEDHGIGMSDDQTARVFERFFRADPSGNIPGTGLGMSLVKEIMDLHLGEVLVRSAKGLGTTVCLSVPGQSPSEASPPTEAPAKESTG